MSLIWLITGSSRGIGREIARAALDAGDQVVATARRPDQLDDLREKYGDQVRAVALDVTDPAAARAAVRTAVDEFGRLDVVVNGAGSANSAPFEETSDQEFRHELEINLYGVVNVTRAALPVLREQRSGRLIQFSSVGGRVGGSPGLSGYQTAKFAVEGFSEVVNAETKHLGIKVTIVEPGAFRTDWGGSSMTMRMDNDDYAESVGAMHAYRRDADGRQPGDPVRAARVIVDLTRLDDPPLRLLLGSDAVAIAAKSSQARAAEAERWADLSHSTDYSPSA